MKLSKSAVVGIFRIQMFKTSETFILSQARHLNEFEPVFLGSRNFSERPENVTQYCIQNGSRHRFFQTLWHALSRDPGSHLRLVKDREISLIHAHFGPDAVYALPFARRLGVPLVTTFHGFDVTVSNRSMLRSRSPYLINYVMFRRQLARRGALFLCVSKHILNHAIKLGFPAQKTILHYIGVDTELMSPNRDKVIVGKLLHVARLVAKKGTEYLIQSLAKLIHTHPQATLTIIGDGPLRNSLQQLACTLGLQEKVEFLGALPNGAVQEHMAETSLFVLPSVTAASGDTEGLPITILEAAAFGIPVIATRHGGIPEAVIDGKTGILVPERDVTALAAAMDRLLSNEAERQSMGAAARAMVEEKFDIRKQTALLEQYYLDLLK